LCEAFFKNHLLLNSYNCTDKKENLIFFISKEIQKGSVAKPLMTNGLIIYAFLIYDFATDPI
jgi:hypothetical protein